MTPSEQPLSFLGGDTYCYQQGGSDDPNQFYYLPGGPRPVKGSVSLIQLPKADPAGDDKCLLALSAVWSIDSKALKQEIAQRATGPDFDPELIELTSAPVVVQGMELSLADDKGVRQTLKATTKTSGMPPFNTVFSLQLEGAQASAVREALGGKSGLLFLSVRFAVRASAASKISGDAGVDALELSKAATDEEAAAQIERSLLAGRLLLSRTLSPPGLVADLGAAEADVAPGVAAADGLAKASAASMLLAQATQLAEDAAAAPAPTPPPPAQEGKHGGKPKHPPPPPPPPPPPSFPLEVENATTEMRVPSGERWLERTTDLGVWAAANPLQA